MAPNPRRLRSRPLRRLPRAPQALRRFFGAGERVGLKVNGLAGRQAATHVELVDELAALLAAADVDPARQVVFDRLTSDLVQAGFTAERQGYRCVGNEVAGYEEEPAIMPSSASRLPGRSGRESRHSESRGRTNSSRR